VFGLQRETKYLPFIDTHNEHSLPYKFDWDNLHEIPSFPSFLSFLSFPASALLGRRWALLRHERFKQQKLLPWNCQKAGIVLQQN
jgi:hypothetical protein